MIKINNIHYDFQRMPEPHASYWTEIPDHLIDHLVMAGIPGIKVDGEEYETKEQKKERRVFERRIKMMAKISGQAEKKNHVFQFTINERKVSLKIWQ